MQRVHPVKLVIGERARPRAVLVEEDQVRREAILVYHPTPNVLGVVDVVVLKLF